jgi:adenosylcobinamide kinase/adenosylcobinamide-phosphate guanylyltransferase
MGKLTFILGGARSGKSSYAQRLAEKHGGQVALIATATTSDEEMAARIRKHQNERPPGWITREIPQGVAAALKVDPLRADVILLDCLTLLVSNLLLQDSESEVNEASAALPLESEITALLATVRDSRAVWIIVSNEVGLGLVPPYPLGRIYRDLLGRANQQVAAIADEVFWMVAGIPVPIEQYREVHESRQVSK